MRKWIPREVLEPKEAAARICTINHSIMELWGRIQPIFCSNLDWRFGSWQKPKTESLSNPLLLKTHVYFERNLFRMFLILLHLSHPNCIWTEFDIWRNFWVILSFSSIKEYQMLPRGKVTQAGSRGWDWRESSSAHSSNHCSFRDDRRRKSIFRKILREPEWW